MNPTLPREEHFFGVDVQCIGPSADREDHVRQREMLGGITFLSVATPVPPVPMKRFCAAVLRIVVSLELERVPIVAGPLRRGRRGLHHC